LPESDAGDTIVSRSAFENGVRGLRLHGHDGALRDRWPSVAGKRVRPPPEPLAGCGLPVHLPTLVVASC